MISIILLEFLYSFMLYFGVFVQTEPQSAKRISRPPTVPFLSRIPARPRLITNSHEINSFADPHPLTLFTSILYKNIGGVGQADIYPQQFPLWNESSSIQALSFHALSRDPFSIPFLFKFIQEWGVYIPLRIPAADAPYPIPLRASVSPWQTIGLPALPSQPAPVLSFGGNLKRITYD